MRWLALLPMLPMLLPTPASAEGGLTLPAALRLARERNLTLQISGLEVAAAKAQETTALSPLIPQAGFQLRAFRNWTEVAFNLPPGLLPGGKTQVLIQPREQVEATLTATLPLVVPAAYGSLRAAQAQRRAQARQHQANTNDVLFAVARAFFAIASAEEVLTAREHAVKVAAEALRTTRVRLQAGVVRSVEVSRAELQEIRARQTRREAGDAVRAARRALATALALDRPARVTPPPADRPVAVKPESILVAEALRARPDLLAARAQVAAAEKALSATRWRLAPSLLAFANLRGTNAPAFAPTNFAWSVGVMLDVPLFSGGRRVGEIELAGTRLRQARLRLQTLADRIATEVRDRRDAVVTARAGLDAAERAVRIAKTTLELVQVQRQVGTATQLEEIDAQDRVVAAEITVAQARFQVALARLALQRAAGEPPGEAPEAAPAAAAPPG